MTYDDKEKLLLGVPVDNNDGTFTFVDFGNIDIDGVRPPKDWPSDFYQWRRFIKYVFGKNLPKPYGC